MNTFETFAGSSDQRDRQVCCREDGLRTILAFINRNSMLGSRIIEGRIALQPE
jgi:hypothetical protein